MPGVYQLSVDMLAARVRGDSPDLGIPAVILFGIPEHKDASAPRPMPRTASSSRRSGRSRQAVPELVVITDVCFCEYTDHGHCGVIARRRRSDNDADAATILAKEAVSHARAGADMVAPSDMMDGRVSAHPRGAGRRTASSTSRSWPTRPSTPPASTARSARRPSRRRSSATGGPTRWTRPTAARRMREVAAGRRRGRRHRHGQAGAGLPRHHPAGARRVRPARWPPTTSAASTPWSRPPRRAGWIDERAHRSGDAHRHQARRRRHDPDLLRQGRGPLAGRKVIR